MRNLVFFFLGRRGEGGGRKFFSFLCWGCCHAIKPRQKMVTNRFGNKSSMQPMKGSAWTHEGSSFFLFVKEEWGEDFFSFFPCSHHVPYGSHGIPQFPRLFLKTVPNSTYFYPIWFA
jgi:hypothetical protein